MQWVTHDDFEVLGIVLNQAMEDLIDKNYKPRIAAMEKCFNFWKSWGLSLNSRALVVKSLGISRLVYQMSMLPSPTVKQFRELSRVLNNYLWGGGEIK